MTIAPPSAVDVPLRPRRSEAPRRTVAAAPAAPLTRAEPACWLLLTFAAICGGLSVFSWRDAVLALLALPPLLFALWPRRDTVSAKPLVLAFAASLLPLLWLIPLPASVVLMLPGRAGLLQPAVNELGIDLWLPASLLPEATWQAWLKTIPPLALFAAALRASDAARHRLLFALIVLAAVQALWALLQLPAGSDEILYLYGTDAAARGGGAFANRSHLAGLLALLLPVFAMFVLTAPPSRHAPARRAALAAGALLLIAAMLATRSRAGACLLAFEVAVLLLWIVRRRPLRTVVAVLAAMTIASALMLSAAGPQLLQGFALDVADGRAALLERSFAAAVTFFPFGSGAGTFSGVFATFDTTATLDTVFVNHAHDEPVQLLFELGLVGVALYAFAFAAALNVLVRHANDGLRWASALGVAAALLHSLVDYPLRVPLPALACAALAACALSPRPRSRP